jgi:hypothetical protein
MRSKRSLILTGRSGSNNITKRFVLGWAAKSTSFPFSQVVLHSAFKRFSIDDPWFPHRAWHDAYFSEFFMSRLWPVSTAHGHGQSGNFSPTFKAGIS